MSNGDTVHAMSNGDTVHAMSNGDTVHAMSNGEVLTLECYPFGFGHHNITGQKGIFLKF